MIEMSYITYYILFYFAFNMAFFILSSILSYFIVKYDLVNNTTIRKDMRIINSDEDSHFILKSLDIVFTFMGWVFFAPAYIVIHFLIKGENILEKIHDDEEDEIKGVE